MQRGKGQHVYYLPTKEGLRLYEEQASQPENWAEIVAFAILDEKKEGRPPALDFSELSDRLELDHFILEKGIARAKKRNLIIPIRGLSDCEQAIMKYLLERKDKAIAATQIYKELSIGKHSLKGALDRLHKKQLVERVPQSYGSCYLYKLNPREAGYALDRRRWLKASGLEK